MNGPAHTHWRGQTLILHVYVQARASRNELVSWHEKGLKIRLKAAPVDGQANLQLRKYLAKLFKVEPDVLKQLNPRLRFRGLTPPTLSTFKVALPASLTVNDDHLKQLNHLKQNKHEKWKVHKVRQGETLWSISRFYRIPLSKILAYNRLKRRNILRIGQKLMLPVPIDWNPPKIPSKTKLALRDIDKLPGVTKIHIVQKGETLWQISQMYNVPIRKIKYWNRRVLRRRYLKIGTEIVLKLPFSVASNSI